MYAQVLNENAAAFAARRVEIALDPTTDPADALRAMEGLDSRVLGRPVQPTEDVGWKPPETIEDWDKLAQLLRYEDDVD